MASRGKEKTKEERRGKKETKEERRWVDAKLDTLQLMETSFDLLKETHHKFVCVFEEVMNRFFLLYTTHSLTHTHRPIYPFPVLNSIHTHFFNAKKFTHTCVTHLFSPLLSLFVRPPSVFCLSNSTPLQSQVHHANTHTHTLSPLVFT